ncbi:pro-opiomelanocortin-like [Pungitius pungitius]|uniref:pro-opiomelanocortin-like n=1 Tax=Pungitius pungitius TaxID=134920 RepID=UPI001886C571|nr:pro-opiomelanocortin-like [Pungitius pungitius]
MACLSWVMVVLLACVGLPGFGSVCLDRSQCDELSNEGKIQDCVRRCVPATRPEAPELDASAPEVNDNDAELPLSVLLAALVSENRVPESDVKGPRGDERRSYSMEHFRWGKPSGRKRRPVKVFASSPEGGGPSGRVFPPDALARRQLGLDRFRVRDLKEGSRKQGSQRVALKAQAPARKDGAYRMSHFRWGSPPPSKRNGGAKKPPARKPKKGQLEELLRNIVIEGVQRRMG